MLMLALLGASSAFAAGWAQRYGSLPGSAQTQATAVDTSGNVYIAGYFNGATLVMGSVTLTRIGNEDAFVAKLDANGTVVWAKNYGGFGANVNGYGIAVDGSGQVYLTGTFDADLTTPVLTIIGYDDVFALKLDASGNTLWAKNYGGINASANGQGIAVDGAGNVYLGGYFDADLTTPALAKIGNSDAFALKLDASGNTTWARNYGGVGANAESYGIAVDGSGNVYLAGNVSNANLTTPAVARIGNRDAFALKVDSSGSTTWARNYGGSGASAYGNGIAVDGFGNVYLGGYFENANLTAPALIKIGFKDAFALKADSSGATVWAKNYGGIGAQAFGAGIAVDGLGNVYLSGDFAIASITVPALTKIGFGDAFALKLDASGSTTWAKNYGGTGASAYGYDIAVDGLGNVYLGGYFQQANLTTPALTLIGSQDAYVLKETATAYPVFSVSYSGNTSTGGSVPTDGTAYVSGATVTVLGNTGTLVKTGSTFSGWNTAANGSGTSYAGAATFAMGSGNVTLYAQWTFNATLAAIPTLSEWSLIVLSGLMALFGFVQLRRRHGTSL